MIILLIFQFCLIGFSIYVLAGGFGKPEPRTIAIQSTCLAMNLFCVILTVASFLGARTP